MLLPRALRRVASSMRPAALRSASTAAAVQDATAAVVQKPPPDPKTVADMRRPEWWYPKARLSKRTIIYHGGPTNSGKTYHALEALKRTASSRVLCQFNELFVGFSFVAALAVCSCFVNSIAARTPPGLNLSVGEAGSLG